MEPLLVICGPTATGKTKLALQLAKEFNGEIVSADSRQIYRGMDIGTGKDTLENRKKKIEKRIVEFKSKQYELIPYEINDTNVWMYDVVNPDEEFSVSHYVHLATQVIEDMHKRNKLPILVGGTGLYIKALLDGVETIDIPRNEELRKKLENKSLEELQQILTRQSSLAFESMNNSDRNNPRRLVRKIEILSAHLEKAEAPTSGVSHGTPDVEEVRKPVYNHLSIGLTAPIETVSTNITTRVKERVDQGIIQEIQMLLDRGYSWQLPSLDTFGYKEWKQYFDNPNEETKQKAIEEWTRDEIGYVKKQMTWFNKQKNIQWYDVSQETYANKVKKAVTLWYTLK